MDQPSGTTPIEAPAQESQSSILAAQPADGALAAAGTSPGPPEAQSAGADSAESNGAYHEVGFRSRGRARRRARFLRKARELAYRDLGGLVFNLHRFGQRNDTLVLAKLTTLGHIDAELRAIEISLGERQAVTVLREAGIAACPRCAAIHSSEDNFCPNCGLSLGRHADLPAGFQSGAGVAPATPAPPANAAGAPPATPAPPATSAPPATLATFAPPATPAPPETPAPEGPTAGEEEGPTEILRPSAPRG